MIYLIKYYTYYHKYKAMIFSIVRWLMMRLLTNPRISKRVAANNRLMCVLFVTAHPDWGLAWITERLSLWYKLF